MNVGPTDPQTKLDSTAIHAALSKELIEDEAEAAAGQGRRHFYGSTGSPALLTIYSLWRAED